MIKIKETDKVVSIKFKRQRGFNLFELTVILAAIAIIAAVAVPRFFDFTDRASEKLLNTATAELNGGKKLVFAEIKNSQMDDLLFELTGKILKQRKMAKILRYQICS